jgi:hypothetical protein
LAVVPPVADEADAGANNREFKQSHIPPFALRGAARSLAAKGIALANQL